MRQHSPMLIRALHSRLALLAVPMAILMAPALAGAQPATYDFDADRSFVHFEVLHFNTSTTRGRFGPIAGSATMDRSARRGELSLRIPTGTVSTSLPFFDARLRQPDFLDSDAQPEAFFVASSLRFEGERLAEVRGEFTLRGLSQPLSLTALRFACRQDLQRQRDVCGGDFEARFNRSDFGSTFGLPFVGDSVRLLVQVEGVRR